MHTTVKEDFVMIPHTFSNLVDCAEVAITLVAVPFLLNRPLQRDQMCQIQCLESRRELADGIRPVT